MKRADARVSALARAGAFALATTLLAGATGAAALGAGEPKDRIVALAYDAHRHALVKASSTALYGTTDGGRTWRTLALPGGMPQGRIAAVAISPQAPGTMYVAGPGLGVLRSDDAGRTWTAKNDGLPARDAVALAAHADQAATVYVYVAGHGIFRSEDGGDHWRLMDAGPRDRIGALVHSNMPGSMQTGWLFAATPKGVGRSMDCFCGWRDAGALGVPVTGIAYDPREPARVYAATAAGIELSNDGGEHWSRARSPEGVTAVTGTPTAVVIAAGAALFRSTDQGASWQRVGA